MLAEMQPLWGLIGKHVSVNHSEVLPEWFVYQKEAKLHVWPLSEGQATKSC